MRKFTLFFTVFMLFFTASFATIRIVDINGGGQYTTIQAGINAASNNDTVLVWPGTYNEKINLNKNITLMGSGYENTIITSNLNRTVTISDGTLQWFTITSLAGDGIYASPIGRITNCVVKSCAGNGIVCVGNIIISNCITIYNGSSGIYSYDGYPYVVNCISYFNTSYGFNGDGYSSSRQINLSYSNGSRLETSNNMGVISQDPGFPSPEDYHVTQGTPCWDTGHPSLKDPDGTRSDMGYFGGPDAPIYPVVYEITTSPNGNNINIQAKARANY